MEYRRLGKTGLQVSAVAMGCWAIVGDQTWGRQDERDALAAIKAAYDAGVNFFDTAEAYGDGYSEEMIAKALAGRRHEVVIATKASPRNHSRERLAEACERSLRHLKTDYIDLYQLHWPSREVPFSETVDALEKLRQEGKIRSIGLSNFGKDDLSQILQISGFLSDQVPYSLLWRAVEYEISARCLENSIGLLPYSPLSQGLLTGKFLSAEEVPDGRARTRLFSKERALTRHGEDGCEREVFEAISAIRSICERIGEPMGNVALAWLLHQPGVVSVLAGARNGEQMRQNARAAELKLSDDALEKLTQATEELKKKVGHHPDMWESVPTSRIR
jgi:aryl-alcohol dehydrogenase-like predicted oxidoreductase